MTVGMREITQRLPPENPQEELRVYLQVMVSSRTNEGVAGDADRGRNWRAITTIDYCLRSALKVGGGNVICGRERNR